MENENKDKEEIEEQKEQEEQEEKIPYTANLNMFIINTLWTEGRKSTRKYLYEALGVPEQKNFRTVYNHLLKFHVKPMGEDIKEENPFSTKMSEDISSKTEGMLDRTILFGELLCDKVVTRRLMVNYVDLLREIKKIQSEESKLDKQKDDKSSAREELVYLETKETDLSKKYIEILTGRETIEYSLDACKELYENKMKERLLEDYEKMTVHKSPKTRYQRLIYYIKFETLFDGEKPYEYIWDAINNVDAKTIHRLLVKKKDLDEEQLKQVLTNLEEQVAVIKTKLAFMRLEQLEEKSKPWITNGSK
jgi:hypothetical protein